LDKYLVLQLQKALPKLYLIARETLNINTFY
jgi:hypothetical protein